MGTGGGYIVMAGLMTWLAVTVAVIVFLIGLWAGALVAADKAFDNYFEWCENNPGGWYSLGNWDEDRSISCPYPH